MGVTLPRLDRCRPRSFEIKVRLGLGEQRQFSKFLSKVGI